MNNPYDVLGVPQNATRDQINSAYREKAREYSEKNQLNKLDELNEAYDSVILNAGASGSSQSGYSQTSSGKYYNTVDYSDIAAKISAHRLEDAQILLDGIPEGSRGADWYFLKGAVYEKKGWLEQAANMYATAHGMEPSNSKFRAAYEKVTSQQNGGYKTARRSSNSGCGGSFCDMCLGLLCLDSCCECMGGDCIPGC